MHRYTYTHICEHARIRLHTHTHTHKHTHTHTHTHTTLRRHAQLESETYHALGRRQEGVPPSAPALLLSRRMAVVCGGMRWYVQEIRNERFGAGEMRGKRRELTAIVAQGHQYLKRIVCTLRYCACRLTLASHMQKIHTKHH
jgi:hypothetical protein